MLSHDNFIFRESTELEREEKGEPISNPCAELYIITVYIYIYIYIYINIHNIYRTSQSQINIHN